MGLGFILQPRRLLAGQLSASATAGINAAFPVTALLDAQPKAIVQTNVSGSAPFSLTLDLDFGADVPMDTLALMFANVSAAASWTVHATAGAAALTEVAGNLLASGAFGQPSQVPGRGRHGLWAGAAVINRRRVRVRLTEPALTSPAVISVGQLLVGERWQPGDIFGNFELGTERSIDDRSIKRTLPGGETYVERGARVPGWSALWSRLSHAEMRRVWGLLADLGLSQPLLMVEDPDNVPGQNEAMHYGMIERLEPVSRTQDDKNRIDLTIREML